MLGNHCACKYKSKPILSCWFFLKKGLLLRVLDMLTKDTAGIRYFQHTQNMGLGLFPVISSMMS